MEVFFITGSSGGIGKALAEEALSRGHQVVGYSRTCTIEHKRYTHISVDLSQESELFNFEFPEVETNAERVVLVNNAGAIGDIHRIGEASDHAIADLFRLNVTCPTILMNKFIAQFGSYRNPTILNVGSGAGQHAIDAWAPYCASKAALDHFCRVVQAEQELSGGKVRVLSVGPGVVDTGMQDAIRQADPEQFSRAEHFKALKENNELVPPQQVAKEYFQVLDQPSKFNDLIMSLRDLREA